MSAALKRAPSATKTILIVDDHPVLRRGLTALIESDPNLAVCGEAASYRAALEAIRKRPPDLVIVDIELKGGDGLELIKYLKTHNPEIGSLVLSMHDEAVYAERALRAGAAGYVSKQQLDETILLAIRRVLDGETYMSEKLGARLATKYLAGGTLHTGSPLEALSDRELQVFRLIGQGRTTRQIAQSLSLSIKTIESHVEHIKQKLVLQSASELAQRATQWVESGRAS